MSWWCAAPAVLSASDCTQDGRAEHTPPEIERLAPNLAPNRTSEQGSNEGNKQTYRSIETGSGHRFNSLTLPGDGG